MTSRKLQNEQGIAYSEPLKMVRLEKAKAIRVNDPEAGKQYHLDLLEMRKAWSISQGKSKINIAIVDTGIDLNHPDLKAKIRRGKNVIDPQKQPMDDNGHGTHVAGIAAAIANNGIGVAGIAPECSIIPVKVLKNGSGSDVDIAEGIVWAVLQGADVINLSVGLYGESKAMERAVNYALSKRVVVVASAGNSSKNARNHLPSMIKGVIEVSASNQSDKFTSFSNFGQQISVAAPGENILSTLPTYNVDVTSSAGRNYGVLSGTSMATPMVAGFAALLKSHKRDLTAAQVKEIIERTALDLGKKGYDPYYGNGRIDIYKTMNNL